MAHTTLLHKYHVPHVLFSVSNPPSPLISRDPKNPKKITQLILSLGLVFTFYFYLFLSSSNKNSVIFFHYILAKSLKLLFRVQPLRRKSHFFPAECIFGGFASFVLRTIFCNNQFGKFNIFKAF